MTWSSGSSVPKGRTVCGSPTSRGGRLGLLLRGDGRVELSGRGLADRRAHPHRTRGRGVSDGPLQRRPPAGTVVHADRGSQYTSWLFGHRLREAELLGLMGRVASSQDNAAMESFWSPMQRELLDRRSWPSKQVLTSAMFEWIEGWYNPRRRHSGIEMLSPHEFETLHSAAVAAAWFNQQQLSGKPGQVPDRHRHLCHERPHRSHEHHDQAHQTHRTRLPQQPPLPSPYPATQRPPGTATPLDQPRRHAQLRIATKARVALAGACDLPVP